MLVARVEGYPSSSSMGRQLHRVLALQEGQVFTHLRSGRIPLSTPNNSTKNTRLLYFKVKSATTGKR